MVALLVGLSVCARAETKVVMRVDGRVEQRAAEKALTKAAK